MDSLNRVLSVFLPFLSVAVLVSGVCAEGGRVRVWDDTFQWLLGVTGACAVFCLVGLIVERRKNLNGKG